jgi:hypothetical protein
MAVHNYPTDFGHIISTPLTGERMKFVHVHLGTIWIHSVNLCDKYCMYTLKRKIFQATWPSSAVLFWLRLYCGPATHLNSLSCTIKTMEVYKKQNKTNSVALSPQVNYTDWVTATCRWNLVLTFADRDVSRGQWGGSPMVINLSLLDRSRYFTFK